jgi:hypothetical protein
MDPHIRYDRLAFEVDLFFSLGSPLGLFLLLRGTHNLKEDNFKFPKVERLLNCFHPYDPVAYRLEPLVSPVHAKVCSMQSRKSLKVNQLINPRQQVNNNESANKYFCCLNTSTDHHHFGKNN